MHCKMFSSTWVNVSGMRVFFGFGAAASMHAIVPKIPLHRQAVGERQQNNHILIAMLLHKSLWFLTLLLPSPHTAFVSLRNRSLSSKQETLLSRQVGGSLPTLL